MTLDIDTEDYKKLVKKYGIIDGKKKHKSKRLQLSINEIWKFRFRHKNQNEKVHRNYDLV